MRTVTRYDLGTMIRGVEHHLAAIQVRGDPTASWRPGSTGFANEQDLPRYDERQREQIYSGRHLLGPTPGTTQFITDDAAVMYP
jgi:hypothetical protein